MTAPLAAAQKAVFARLDTDPQLRAAVGTDADGLILASPKWPDIPKLRQNQEQRLVYRVTVSTPLGGVFRASVRLHAFVLTDTVAETVEERIRDLFGEQGWVHNGWRMWAAIEGSGDDPQVEDDDPIHQYTEIQLDGSLT